MSGLTIESPAFAPGAFLPSKHTCDGPDVSPPLRIGNVPDAARSVAIIMDDPDSRVGTWVHWLIWNIPPGTGELPEGVVPEGAVEGTNDFGTRKYGGPCPAQGTHRYFFRLYALDRELALEAGATRARLEDAMKGHVLAQAELFGVYRRA